ncbi:MAG: TonB-dependent receptor, partial [Gemmatimonadetes bacterium]|nr:TonB-dependent receptor [Gemmatimonadota bacterium]
MRVLYILAFVLWNAYSVIAQDFGNLTGKVKTEDGVILFGANIIVKGPAIEGVRRAITNDQGVYRIDRLPPGIYEITISYIGYETVVVSNIEIRAGESITRDFTLTAVDLIGQQVVVSASRKQEKALDAPASISIVDASEIRNREVLTMSEYVKTLPGVDYAQTGISQGSMVVRGFNSVFSGTLLTLVDNRIARIPSLRLNAYDLIPLTSDDIERIEIVLGPGSALYGPNSANGVMHIITRSPFGSEGNTISISGGQRSVRKLSLRHASSLNNKIGIKVSGGYVATHDWEYVDPLEVEARGFNPRDYSTERTNGEFRLDFRPTDELTLIGSVGYSKMSGLQQTDLGAGQAKDWTYNFYQGRLLYRGWFAQVFYNTSDAGDTELITAGDPIVDNSYLMVLQLQHNASLGQKQHLAYGADVLLTRPKTQGTVHGMHEGIDDIDEYGIYLQSETNLSDQIDLILAGRIDKHSHIEDPFFSPRAALVIKPNSLNTLRLTYNRAFSTPSTPDLFVDRVGVPDVFMLGTNFSPVLGFSPEIDLRAQGNAGTGFTFRRDDNGLPMFRTPFAPIAGLPKDHYFSLHDPQATNLMWSAARGVILDGLLAELEPLAIELLADGLGLSPDQATAMIEQLVGIFPGVIPEQLPGLQNTAAILNTETQGFDPIPDLANAVTDISKIGSTTTETFELGYKGIVKNKLILAADVYQTRIKNFVSPLRIETPNVFLAPGPLNEALTDAITENLKDPANASLALVLIFLDHLNEPEFGLVGNGNGTGIDELTQLFVSNAALIPFGTIAPEQAADPTAVIVTPRNFGRITLYGA